MVPVTPPVRGCALVPRSPEPDRALAAALKRLRKERKMTQEAVAWHAGVAVTATSAAKIENAQTAASWDSVRAG